MILQTGNKTISLKFSTRNIVNMLDAIGSNDVKTLVFNGLNKLDSKLLACIFCQLSEDKMSVNEAYDFIDSYKSENECSIREIYQKIIVEINNNYFFEEKIPMPELSEMMSNPLMTGMDNVVQQAVRDAVGKIAQESMTAPLP